jgi:transcription antitermination factor NusG
MVRNKGFEEFLPTYQSCRRWSDRFKAIEVPLFPGYVFCRINPQQRLPILTIPGALNFVGIANTPAPIEDAEITAIQSAVSSGLLAEPCAFLEIGQRVKIERGPLAGLDGLLIEVRQQYRVVISVTLLRRSVAVEIDQAWVKPLSKHTAAGGHPADPADPCSIVPIASPSIPSRIVRKSDVGDLC